MSGASVLIPAYNEEQNIGPLLQRVLNEDTAGWTVDDIVVIASGCTDGTVERANAVAAADPRVRVLIQEQREGKASAINAGLAVARHDTVVLISGDVLPSPGSVSLLLRRLEDPGVGVVGGRPVPLNDPRTFTGFAAHLQWRLHDAISAGAADPKCGEMIAFRRALDGRPVVLRIPPASAVDEVSIQALAREAGLRSVYEPRAVVQNWAPSTLRDWFVQRRRINAGHILSAREGYRPATMSTGAVFRALFHDREARRRPHFAVSAVAVEATARFLGRLDIARGQGHTVWRVAQSTKRPIEVEQETA